MKKKIRRLVTAMMTLLMLAPSYSAYADAPTAPTGDLKIQGWTVNGANDWDNGINQTYKSHDGKIFYYSVTLGEGRKFRFNDGRNIGPLNDGNSKTDNSGDTEALFGYDKSNKIQYADKAFYVKDADKTSDGKYVVVADFSDAATPVMKIKGGEIKTPSTLYIKGHVNDDKWSSGVKFAQTRRNGSVYYFNVKLTGDADWKDGNGNPTNLSTFRFEDENGNEYGSRQDNKPLEGEQYGCIFDTKSYQLSNGEYTITVDMTNPVSPKVSAGPLQVIEPMKVPDELYILGHVNSTSWEGNGVKYTKKSGKVFKFKVNLYDGWSGNTAFAFTTNSSGTGNGLKGDNSFLGLNGNADSDVTDRNKDDQTAQNAAWGTGYAWITRSGRYVVTVDFSASVENPTITLKRTGDIPKDYYFIGDLNDWFSTEFTDPQWHQGEYEEKGVKTIKPIYEKKQSEDRTVYYEISSNTGATRYCMKNQGIDNNKRDAEKGYWRFEYIDDPDDPDYEKYNGWYRFDAFPEGLLTGQFQIFDGTNWGGEVYSHAQPIPNDDGVNPHWNEYEWYYTAPITREHIINGYTLVKGTYKDEQYDNGNWVTGHLNNWSRGDNAGMIRKSPGQNLHMECNGVKDAVIYFKPGDDPKLKVMGTPVDYYVFYGLPQKDGGDVKTVDGVNEQHVRAKMTEGKPNTNNYYLPGIWYTQMRDGERAPLPNKVMNADGTVTEPEHMNLTGVDLVKVNTRNGTELEKVIKDAGIVNMILGIDETGEALNGGPQLPNGQTLAGKEYDYIWVTKIPNGFENPAGYKYSLQFEKAGDPSVKNNPYTVKLDHMYFFSNVPVHVHVDYSNIVNSTKYPGVTAEVSYRIYKKDAMWNTVVVNTDDNTENTTLIYRRVNEGGIPLTAEDTEANKNLGWVTLNEHDFDCKYWCGEYEENHNHEFSTNKKTIWSIYNPNHGVATYAEGDVTSDDVRHQVHQRHNQSFVQFRVRIKNTKGLDYTLYHPESLADATEKPQYNFGGKDMYVVMDSDDGMWTGVEDIRIEQVDGEYSADDAEPVYYNLQGLRVDKPAHGLYIRVRGNKSDKIYIR